ncbi:hypothetical protein I4F81_000322 [Pyropia yezoensis]|uniref:Uncharacterized protein n=1 Tax=Pyropia yezoensis TaxID=2788 RepID=A0ACC3BIT9_PYRYE|nr:hypothetical protein I4F81_000322 [Neopyropia yezoensis]
MASPSPTAAGLVRPFPSPSRPPLQKTQWSNVALGAGLQLFEVSTLGQPFEVIKTQQAANRTQGLATALSSIYARGGVRGFWQGLVPWAWIEGSTKGAVLLFTQSEVSQRARSLGVSPSWASGLGGMAGGVAQAYTTIGPCTTMKTALVTGNHAGKGMWDVARSVVAERGLAGMYAGVHAVALRQATNWGSRFGFSRLSEVLFRRGDGARALSTGERLASSMLGGALSTWNHPFEVLRIELQSQSVDPRRPKERSMATMARYIYQTNGVRGFYRGVLPRIGLSVYLTVVMVFLGDELKELIRLRKDEDEPQE